MLGFLKLVFLSDQPAAKGKSTTLTANCLRLRCCGKMVCQIPSSGTTMGSVGSCAGAEVNGEAGASLPEHLLPSLLLAGDTVLTCAGCWAFMGFQCEEILQWKLSTVLANLFSSS